MHQKSKEPRKPEAPRPQAAEGENKEVDSWGHARKLWSYDVPQMIYFLHSCSVHF